MAGVYRRASDATFDLNLAPILDIIVSVVPMLLLSIAFVQVKMIETPVPQAVAEAIQKSDEKEQTQIRLMASSKDGFVFIIVNNGKEQKIDVPKRGGNWDYEGLQKAAFDLKTKYPQVFKLDLAPEGDVNLNDLVEVMDKVRKDPSDRKIAFVNPKNGEKLETSLMFPNVVFGNVMGIEMRKAMKYYAQKRSPGYFKIQITSMVDMFVILLVFLLKTFSTSPVIISPKEGLRLPESTSPADPVDVLKMVVSTDGIFVEDKKVVGLDKGVIGKAEFDPNDPQFIRHLYDALNERAKLAKSISKVNDSFEFDGKILVQADRSLPYDMLKRVMYTSMMAGYSDIKFAVVSR